MKFEGYPWGNQSVIELDLPDISTNWAWKWLSICCVAHFGNMDEWQDISLGSVEEFSDENEFLKP